MRCSRPEAPKPSAETRPRHHRLQGPGFFLSLHNTTPPRPRPPRLGWHACIIPTPCPPPIHSSASGNRASAMHLGEPPQRLRQRHALILPTLTIASFPARHSPCTNPHSSRTASGLLVRGDDVLVRLWSARGGDEGIPPVNAELGLPSCWNGTADSGWPGQWAVRTGQLLSPTCRRIHHLDARRTGSMATKEASFPQLPCYLAPSTLKTHIPGCQVSYAHHNSLSSLTSHHHPPFTIHHGNPHR